MLKKLFFYIFIIPLTFILIALAVSNSHEVQFILDPFSSSSPLYVIHGSFSGMLFIALLIGVLLGGLGTWFSQRKWRQAAQLRSREAQEWRREAERLGREAASHSSLRHSDKDALPAP